MLESKTTTPGDDAVGELFKWPTPINRQYLLEAFNKFLDSQYIAPHHLQAVVVSIYKKNDSSQFENYRPISLLNTCYEVFAALIKERLDQGLDYWITSTHYGFRKRRSTAQTIYLARRLQDHCAKSKSASDVCTCTCWFGSQGTGRKFSLDSMSNFNLMRFFLELLHQTYCLNLSPRKPLHFQTHSSF